jgi:hypothetical protein
MQRVTEDSYLKLKSGTDIRGVAIKTERENVELTDEVVSNICSAFAYWYNQKFGKRLGVITVATIQEYLQTGFPQLQLARL